MIGQPYEAENEKGYALRFRGAASASGQRKDASGFWQ